MAVHKLRFAIDAILLTISLAIMSSPTQTFWSVTVLLALLGYLVLESRAVLMEIEEWGWD